MLEEHIGRPERTFCGAPVYKWYGKDMILWRTVKTRANSVNYFTNGIFSKEYFIVEGYKKESCRMAKNISA
jgi:hypothetical protein